MTIEQQLKNIDKFMDLAFAKVMRRTDNSDISATLEYVSLSMQKDKLLKQNKKVLDNRDFL